MGTSLGGTAFHVDGTTHAAQRFGPLKSILGAIHEVYANDEGTVAIGNRIEGLLSRVIALERSFDSRPSDVPERRRRDELRCEFERVEEQLRSLAEMPGTHTEEISGLLEDLREIIFDYQMPEQQKVHNQRRKDISPAEAAVINNFRSAQGAEYRHGNRGGCLKGTRGAVLDEIELWAKDFSKSPVYWLNGLAGTGKTTIAQTIAERLFADGRLGASFFCSRDFEDRRDLQLIFPTLAVQLARNYTGFRSVFVPLVQSDPGIAHESLYNQMRQLIIEPLQGSSISTVIVIDALDECKDEETSSAILSVLGRLISEVPEVKIFLTGRPESRVHTGFRLPLLKKATDVFVLHDAEPSVIAHDVRMFLKHSFLEMAGSRIDLDGWPRDEEIEGLCERAAGLFAYAVATVKFVGKRTSNPRKRLDLLLRSPESSEHEAKTRFKATTTLDLLYTSVLEEAFDLEDGPENDPNIRLVLGAMILAANPLSPSTIATLLGFDTGDVSPILSSAQSLLILRDDITSPVRPFHKSFPDFIMDPNRCTNQRFYISPPDYHRKILILCFDLMDRRLEKNMCKLPDGAANSDIGDLELRNRIERYIDPALRYACKSWHTHLADGRTKSDHTLEVTSALRRFLEKNFLFWLEVLSVLGVVKNAVDALQAAAGCLEESPTLDLANDCCRFVIGYSEIISTSAPHIYHSALVSTPKTSVVRKLYDSYAEPLMRVVHGIPAPWEPRHAGTRRHPNTELAVWSPCNKFIAISPYDTTKVHVLDSAILQQLQSLKFPWETSTHSHALIFSPNSRILTCSGGAVQGAFIVSWDLQTGGVLSAITRQGSGEQSESRITYSTDGKTIGVLHRFNLDTFISIYNVVSGIHMHDVYRGASKGQNSLADPPLHDIWTHGEFLRFATAERTTITFWEVDFTAGGTSTKVETLPVPDIFFDDCTSLIGGVPKFVADAKFLPALCRFAFVHFKSAHGVLVWDARDSKSLLHHTDVGSARRTSFSPDGRFFACSNGDRGIHLWKETSTGYVLHEDLIPSDGGSSPLLSPNGRSIIVFGRSTIQLWHITHSSISTQAPQRKEDFVLDFLPDESLAVVARQRDTVVTVLDLKSGVPRLTINTSMEVYGLRVVGNIVAVIGDGTVITWNLIGGNKVRMDVEDRVQTIDFSAQGGGSVTAASISFDFRHVAFLRQQGAGLLGRQLCVYSASGRRCADTFECDTLWFPPSGQNIWCAARNKAQSYTTTCLEPTIPAAGVEYLPPGCPWVPTRGYQVTNDGWIISGSGKRLLMLPPSWQSEATRRVWNGKYLGLVHGVLPGPVILELEP
ncbi:hypothetical protein BJ322DRAFT_775758 [Thelephora terrestris]|uniref:NACHT domain-containing protein n=1 Tax=Thelephora terrestris TaxID=56493 RepID=A0A9P6L752_9AGAM|nr:hypothetical protein BJ322DRAFT_775758 [Thelephora terrestris]